MNSLFSKLNEDLKNENNEILLKKEKEKGISSTAEIKEVKKKPVTNMSNTENFSKEFVDNLVIEKNQSSLSKIVFCESKKINPKLFSSLVKSAGYFWSISEKKYVTGKLKKISKPQKKLNLTVREVKLNIEAYTILKMKIDSGQDRDEFINNSILNNVSKELRDLAKGFIDTYGISIVKK